MQAYIEEAIDGDNVDHYMGYKEDLQRLHDKIDRVVKRVDDSPTRPPASRWQIGAAIVSACALVLAGWVQYNSHSASDLDNKIKIGVGEQLKDPIKQLGTMSADIAEIKGELKVLDPLIREMTLKQMSAARSFTPKEIDSHLAELGGVVKVARTSKIPIKQQDLQEVGEKVISASRSNPAAWNVALDFLNYKSVLDALSSEFPSSASSSKPITTHYKAIIPLGDKGPAGSIPNGMAVPIEQAARFSPIGEDQNRGLLEGNPYFILDGGGVIIDGMDMKNVIFRGVHIVYHGGPLKMSNVYFANCVFDVVREPTGESFAETFLKSGLSTSFAAG